MGICSNSCAKTVLLSFMGHSFLIGMATGYSEVEIGYGEYIGYHHDSKKLFSSASSNIGTAVTSFIIICDRAIEDRSREGTTWRDGGTIR